MTRCTFICGDTDTAESDSCDVCSRHCVSSLMARYSESRELERCALKGRTHGKVIFKEHAAAALS